MSIEKPVALVVFLASFVFHSAAADSSRLETIVVTASRTPVPEASVGSSMTVIEHDELEQRQSASIAEILRDVPGFAVSRSGVLGSSTQIRVRGAEGNHVMVMIDGIEANDMAQGDEFGFAHLLASDVERIEIIRGPQSALWGSDALAGVINIITRRGAGPITARGSFEAGSFATINGGASLSGGTDRYHFNVGGSVLDAGGANISRVGDEDDGYENTSISFSGGVNALEWLSLLVTGRHVDAHNEWDEIDFFLTGLPMDSDVESDSIQDFAQARVDVDPFAGRWTQHLIAAFSGTDNENYAGGLDTGSGKGKRWTFTWQSDYRLQTTQILPAEHTFTLAVEHEAEDFSQRGPASFFGDPNQDRESQTTAVVGEYRFLSANGLAFSAGGRHDDNSEFRDDTTWRVTGSYLLAATSTRLRGSYGTGSKNPTFTERFGFFATSFPPFVGNPDLVPERSEGWEAGLDQSVAAGRVSIGVTYFNERLRDEIESFVFDPATVSFTAVNKDGTSHREGVEVTGEFALADALQLRAHYTFLDATQPDAAGSQERELRRPRHSGGASLNYAFLDGRGNVNVNFVHTGDQRDLFFPPFPLPQETVTLNAFNLVAVAGSWEVLRNITLFARVENVLDDDYEEVYGFSSPGLAAYAGLRVSLPATLFSR